MSYSVFIKRSAQKQISKIPPQDNQRIKAAIRKLSEVPRPHGCKKLVGRPAFRIRVGNYRIVYEIHDKKLIVLIVDVGHRRDVY